jgi:hypothetical protein
MTDFERWWYDEGSCNRPVDEDIEEFSKRMCEIAWSNGAFKEREACAKLCDDLPAPDSCSGSESSLWDVATVECGDAIRARGRDAA